MSVSASFTLPASPPNGSVIYRPLGGDGFTAPFAAYEITGFLVAGDASGGTASLTITHDARYVSLVSWLTLGVDGAAGAQVFRWSIGDIQVNVETAAITSFGIATNVAKMVIPQPMLGHGLSQQVVLTNTDGDTFSTSTFIYLFDRNVREKSPMGPLLFSRGAT